jgi:hypothetical protein
MKGTILALALLCAGAVFAQTPPPATAAASHMDKLATLLDLTDDQKRAVQKILEDEHAKMKTSIENAKATGSTPDWQALHQKMQQDTLSQLTGVLSATQLQKFQIIQEAMHEHMHHMGQMGHGQPGAPAPPPAQN